jgi:hypothetical protein
LVRIAALLESLLEVAEARQRSQMVLLQFAVPRHAAAPLQGRL